MQQADNEANPATTAPDEDGKAGALPAAAGPADPGPGPGPGPDPGISPEAAEDAAATATADASSAAPVAEQAAPTPAELSPAQCSARLAALFPALFNLQQPKPLKLRIQADIQARAPGVFTRKTLSAFLHRYTTGTPYVLALTRQAQRYDLDGQPAGELAAEHREAAVTELARRRGIVEARRAAEQASRREAEAAARQQHEADQQGRRERAQLLRAFETSTLTRANFCALKGLPEAALDGLLAQARQEAAERPAWTPPNGQNRPAHAPQRPGPRGDGPRPDGPRPDGPRREPGREGRRDARKPDGGRAGPKRPPRPAGA